MDRGRLGGPLAGIVFTASLKSCAGKAGLPPSARALSFFLRVLSLSIPVETPAKGRGDGCRMTGGESSVILPHPPLSSVGVSIAMERGRPQNDRLADGL